MQKIIASYKCVVKPYIWAKSEWYLPLWTFVLNYKYIILWLLYGMGDSFVFKVFYKCLQQRPRIGNMQFPIFPWKIQHNFKANKSILA